MSLGLGVDLFTGDEPVMTLFEDEYAFVLQSEFEKGDHMVGHELRRDGPANKVREFRSATFDTLPRLDRRELVGASFCLNRNYKMHTLAI
jgi:hypothetical protein